MSKKCVAACRDGSACNAWAVTGEERCRMHLGKSVDGLSHRNNANAQKHGLHTSAETFFANAEEHHLDTYYAMHESLCTRYESVHGDLPAYIKKELSEVALEMAKLDMAKEYEAEHAVDPAKPLTELEKQMSEAGPWEREVVSKVEGLKNDIRRENRLLLKDMGIYNSPEKMQADSMGDIARLWEKDLQS